MSYVVESITNKTVTTKFGPKPAYSIKANGDWFSAGFNKPKFNVGDTIDFMYEEGSYGKQLDAKTIRVLSKGAGAAAPSPTGAVDSPATGVSAPRAYGPPAKVFPVPLMHGDRSIIRQNALTNARELVTAAYGGKPFDTTEAKVVIIEIARFFEEYSAGDIERRAAEGSE